MYNRVNICTIPPFVDAIAEPGTVLNWIVYSPPLSGFLFSTSNVTRPTPSFTRYCTGLNPISTIVKEEDSCYKVSLARTCSKGFTIIVNDGHNSLGVA